MLGTGAGEGVIPEWGDMSELDSSLVLGPGYSECDCGSGWTPLFGGSSSGPSSPLEPVAGLLPNWEVQA